MNAVNDSGNRAAYRRPEAARILGISISLMDKMIRMGQVRTIRVGERGVLISRAEIERLVSGS